MSWIINDFFEARKLRNTQPVQIELAVELSHEDVVLLYCSTTKAPDEILIEKEDELLDPDKVWDRKWEKFISLKGI